MKWYVFHDNYGYEPVATVASEEEVTAFIEEAMRDGVSEEDSFVIIKGEEYTFVPPQGKSILVKVK